MFLIDSMILSEFGVYLIVLNSVNLVFFEEDEKVFEMFWSE
jgi:hypothetical protein